MMLKSFNSAQAKLLANFSSDLAKGLLLAGISVQIISKEALFYKTLMMSLNAIIAAVFLTIAINLLKGVKE